MLKSEIRKYFYVLGVDNASLARKVYVTLTSPGLFWLWVHRYGLWVNNRWAEDKIVRSILKFCYHTCKYILIMFTKNDILESVKIGSSLFMSNRGGIIVGAQVLGDNCTIHHNVTIGLGIGDNNLDDLPVIGNNVWIGSDSVIFGNVRIGDGVSIDRGSVVAKNIPDRAVVAGNPGRIVARDFDNSALLCSAETSLEGYMPEAGR